jgi:hypothetical protein
MWLVGFDMKSQKQLSLLTAAIVGVFNNESLANDAFKFAQDTHPNEYVFKREIDINCDYNKLLAKEKIK